MLQPPLLVSLPVLLQQRAQPLLSGEAMGRHLSVPLQPMQWQNPTQYREKPRGVPLSRHQPQSQNQHMSHLRSDCTADVKLKR